MKRDELLLSRLPKAVEQIKSSKRPYRISATRLGRNLEMLASLQAHPEKFPQTARAIGDLVETRQQFAGASP